MGVRGGGVHGRGVGGERQGGLPHVTWGGPGCLVRPHANPFSIIILCKIIFICKSYANSPFSAAKPGKVFALIWQISSFFPAASSRGERERAEGGGKSVEGWRKGEKGT